MHFKKSRSSHVCHLAKSDQESTELADSWTFTWIMSTILFDSQPTLKRIHPNEESTIITGPKAHKWHKLHRRRIVRDLISSKPWELLRSSVPRKIWSERKVSRNALMKFCWFRFLFAPCLFLCFLSPRYKLGMICLHHGITSTKIAWTWSLETILDVWNASKTSLETSARITYVMSEESCAISRAFNRQLRVPRSPHSITKERRRGAKHRKTYDLRMSSHFGKVTRSRSGHKYYRNH